MLDHSDQVLLTRWLHYNSQEICAMSHLILLFWVFWHMVSHCITQTCLKFLSSNDPPASGTRVVGNDRYSTVPNSFRYYFRFMYLVSFYVHVFSLHSCPVTLEVGRGDQLSWNCSYWSHRVAPGTQSPVFCKRNKDSWPLNPLSRPLFFCFLSIAVQGHHSGGSAARWCLLCGSAYLDLIETQRKGCVYWSEDGLHS